VVPNCTLPSILSGTFAKLVLLSKWLFHCSNIETMGATKLYLGFHFVADAFPKLVSISKWLFRSSKRETMGGSKLYLGLSLVVNSFPKLVLLLKCLHWSCRKETMSDNQDVPWPPFSHRCFFQS